MKQRNMNAKRIAMLIANLMDEPITVIELSKRIDLNIHTVRKYVNAMRMIRPKIIRVAWWEEGRNPQFPLPVPAYQLGTGQDAPRPPKKSEALKCREYRARKKARELQKTLGGIA